MNKARSIHDRMWMRVTCVAEIMGSEFWCAADPGCRWMHLTEMIWLDRMAAVPLVWAPGLSDDVHRFDVGIGWNRKKKKTFRPAKATTKLINTERNVAWEPDFSNFHSFSVFSRRSAVALMFSGAGIYSHTQTRCSVSNWCNINRMNKISLC